MKKIKNILFKLELEGNGIVNNDSKEQTFAFANENGNNVKHLKDSNKNVTYAKKNFYRDENGELDYKIKISSDALRNSMFRNDLVAQTSAIQHNDVVLHSFIATPIGMIRGYMFAANGRTYKRKSPLTITDAEQTSTNKSYLEQHAKSGEKDTHKDKEGSDITIFKKESIGNVTYSSEGNINLVDLQFVGCDSVFDRISFNADLFETLYKPYAELNIPNFNGKLGYYTLSTSIVDMAEYGLKISDENVVFLIKETLKRILGINILRNGSFARTKTLKIKMVSNPLVDTIKGEDGWLEIKTLEDLEKIDFTIAEFYSLADETKAKAVRESVELAYQQEQQKRKDKKEELAKNKKDKKVKKSDEENITADENN